MISEVVPRGKEFLFFSVFSVIGKTSSFIGPFVSSAIIERATSSGWAQPTNAPFIFLLALGAISFGIIWLVDVPQSRRECRRYLEEEARRVYGIVGGEETGAGGAGHHHVVAVAPGEVVDVDDKVGSKEL